MVCAIFYITLATLRRRPRGSQEGALGAPGLLTLALAWPLSGPGLSLAVAWAVAWPWPGPCLAVAWPWPGPGLGLARVLGPGGLLLANLSDRAPFPLVRDLVAALGEHLPHVLVSAEPATLRARRAGNLLVVAGAAGVPRAALAARARSAGAPYRVLDDVAVASSFGGGRVRRDPGGTHSGS